MPSILITRLVSLYMFSSILWLFGPKEKFINCSLISYVFLVCWFGFLKTCEKKKKPSVFLVGFYFNWTIRMMLGDWGLCNMSSFKFIEISLIMQNLLNGIFSMSVCLCVYWSFLLFLLVLMVKPGFIYARQVFYHWLSFCFLFLLSLSLRLSVTLSLVNWTIQPHNYKNVLFS